MQQVLMHIKFKYMYLNICIQFTSNVKNINTCSFYHESYILFHTHKAIILIKTIHDLIYTHIIWYFKQKKII